MPVISTNLAANSAVRYLNINSTEQTASLSKLASGSRISQASDDAAGLAISTKISSDVTALTQAATNASHGVSVLQTADGGASNISDILQRMKSLASQSSSGTVTDTERAYIEAEFSQLIEEVDGIATGTRYNAQSLLDGSSAFADGISIMVGSSASDTVSVQIATLTSASLGLTTSDIVTNSGAAAATTAGSAAGSVDISAGINFSTAETLTISIDGGTAVTAAFSTTGGSNSDGTYTQAEILSTINTALGTSGTASVDTNGNIVVTSATTGTSSTVSMASNGSALIDATPATTTAGSATGSIVISGGITFSANETLTIAVDGGTAVTAAFTTTGGTSGTYTQAQILSTITAALGTSGTASVDTSGHIVITSATSGATSSVALSSNGAALAGTVTTTAGTSTATATATAGTSTTATTATLAGTTTGYTVTSDDVSFEVNGTKVTLSATGGTAGNGVYTVADLVTTINSALTAKGNTAVTASAATSGGALTFTSSTTGAAAKVTIDKFDGLEATDLGLTATTAATSLSVTDQASAIASISKIDAAIDTVSKARANIGALESRFSFRSESIATSIENLEAANSAITDTDVAAESSKLASAKVKTQAAVAAAAQASQMPQDLLKLLQ